MALALVAFLTSLAVFSEVTGVAVLLSSGNRHDANANQPAVSADVGTTPPPAAEATPPPAAASTGAAGGNGAPAITDSAGNASGGVQEAAFTPAPAVTTAAPPEASNFVTYKPDKFYVEDFALDEDNPLEELSFSPTYPTSRPLNATDEAGPSAETLTANTTASSEAPEATATNIPNASTVQIKKAIDALMPMQPTEAETAEVTPATASAANTSAELPATKAPAEASAASVAARGMPGCVTRKEARAGAWFAETSPEGTPCLFGIDSRDEGSHCILDNGKYGSNGWCYTAEDATGWGSCAEKCPLHGSAAAMAQKIDVLANAVGKLKGRLADARAAGMIGGAALLEQNETLLKRGQSRDKGPIEWIRSWLSSDDLNASAQIAVSGSDAGKETADTKAQGQVVAIPLNSQLLQQTPPRAPNENPELAPKSQHPAGNQGSGEVVKVKLQSQLLQKKKAPRSKHAGAVVSVKLQSQLLQKKNTLKTKKNQTSLMHHHKRNKAAQQINSSKSKRGVVVVKLQSQL